jgi:hypothetical protein
MLYYDVAAVDSTVLRVVSCHRDTSGARDISRLPDYQSRAAGPPRKEPYVDSWGPTLSKHTPLSSGALLEGKGRQSMH